MNDNQNEETISPLKAIGFSAFGMLTAIEASGAAQALTEGYINQAFIHGSLAALFLNATHGILKEEWQMKDDAQATGLKNQFVGFAAGSTLALMSPNPYALLSEQQETELSMISPDAIVEYVEEEPRYPALNNVSFG